MTHIDEQGRPEPPMVADEVTSLLGFLNYQRATLEWKCSGLDAEGFGQTMGVSSMTLGGMLKHLAFVEDSWTFRALSDLDWPTPWDTVDWPADEDWDWNSAADDSPEELRAFWRNSVDRSQALIDQALAESGVEGLAKRKTPSGEAIGIRWILLHLIEEYARHNGHADLLREAVDGQTGE